MRILKFAGVTFLYGFVMIYSTSLTVAGESDPINLYRVVTTNSQEAIDLTNTGADAFMRVSEGYLVLAGPGDIIRMEASGLTYNLVAANVRRHNLFTITERTSDFIDGFPLIFNEKGLRLYLVGDEEMEVARDKYGLRNLRSENLRIRYQEPVQINIGEKISIELDSLVNRVLQDSLESYLYHLDGYDSRWWGTTGNALSRVWLYNKLRNYGYDSVYFDEFSGIGQTGDYAEGKNVVAVKPGTTYPEIHIVIGAHLDTGSDEYYHYPGADDNGSGTGGVLEIARTLADVDTRFTFVFILFDAEEEWMVGSAHYANHAAADDRKMPVMINLDMIGHEENDTEAFLHYYINDAYAQLWTQLAASIPGIGITGHVTDDMGLVSDQGPFAEVGYDVVFVQEYEFSTHYHENSDSAVYLNFDYMTRMVKTSLATAFVTDQQFEPAYELHMTIPGDLPEIIYPSQTNPVEIIIREYGGAQIIPGSVLLHYAVNDGEEATVSMNPVGNDVYSGNLPALSCLDGVRFYFSAEDESLGIVYYPGQNESILATVATGTFAIFEDYFDTDQGWTINSDAMQGEWILTESSRDFDGNGYYYSTSGFSGVSGGSTSLFSPPIEVDGNNCIIEYARWSYYFSEPEPGHEVDRFRVSISSNGSVWNMVEEFEPDISREWKLVKFPLSDYIDPPQTVWLRFDVSEYGHDDFVRAAVDAVRLVGYYTDLRIVTSGLPNWTAGHPISCQLEAADCGGDILTWTDRFNQLDGTGLTLSTDGLMSGIPTRVGPVVFRAEVTDQSGGYHEQSLDFIVYDSLKITTAIIPAATTNEMYVYQLRLTGGTGDKTWSDHDGGLATSGVALSADGLLSGTPPTEGEYSFTARITDEVGAFADREFTLRIIGPYVCGDANSDEAANVADAVYLINYVFKGGPAPDPIESGDANCDGVANVGDAVYLINYVFKGGPEPCCP